MDCEKAVPTSDSSNGFKFPSTESSVDDLSKGGIITQIGNLTFEDDDGREEVHSSHETRSLESMGRHDYEGQRHSAEGRPRGVSNPQQVRNQPWSP